VSVQEDHSLLELEEAVEALEAALDFKNQSVRDHRQQLSLTAAVSRQSRHNVEATAHLCDVTRKLKNLSQTEASDLLFKYFNKARVQQHTRIQ